MAESVKVAVRVRPFNQREKDRNAKLIIDMDGPNTSITNPENGEVKPFAFDYSYWSHDGFTNDENGYSTGTSPKYASQRTVYEDLGGSVLANAWNGYNCSLFAYGQTGAGKSYSMVGYGTNKGIIPISCEEMFKRIGENNDPNKQYMVTVSMLEIYNEKVKDLLNPKINPPGGLNVRQDKARGVYVESLTPVPCNSYKEIEQQMENGTTNRTVASTNMNATSSRAHTVFTIIFSIVTNQGGQKSEIGSKINLVDLAGSERAESTGATGDRLKEGCAINQSLSALGNVISALADQSMGKKGVFVPYRNSVLTRLLQDALGGNSKTIMIAALSPADINFEETLSTLRYADRAKKIKNAAKKNENPTERLIRELREENERLKKAMGGEVAVGGGVSNEDLERMKREKEEIERMLQEQAKSWEEKLAEAQRSGLVGGGGDPDERRQKLKSLPHIKNLNEDSMLSEQIIYFLERGTPMRVGRKDAPEPKPQIVLTGASVQRQHCTLSDEEDGVYVEVQPGAKVHVNGRPVAGRAGPLAHLSRIFLGHHVWRLHDPRVEAKEAPEQFDWEFAQRELAEATGQGVNLAEKARELDEDAAKKKAEYDSKLRELEQELAGAAPGDAMLARFKELQRELEHQKQLKEELEEGALKRKRELAAMEDALARLIPEVNEMNTMSEEMRQRTLFELRLVDTVPEAAHLSPLEELRQLKKVDVQLRVFNSATKAVWTWSREKFDSRLHLARDLYARWMDEGPFPIPRDDNVFWDPPLETPIGRAHLYLEPLAYLFDISETLPVVDAKGNRDGAIRVELIPCAPDGQHLQPEAAAVDDPLSLVGRRMDFIVSIPWLQNLPQQNCNRVRVSYRFYVGDDDYSTEPFGARSANPNFNYRRQFTVDPVTADFIHYLRKDAITFQVTGEPDATEPTPFEPTRPGARPRTASMPAIDEGLIRELNALKLEKEAMARELAAAKAGGPSGAELEAEKLKSASLRVEMARKDEELEALRQKASRLEELAERLRQEAAEKKMVAMSGEEKEKFKKEMVDSLAKSKDVQAQKKAAAFAAAWERAAGKEGTALQAKVSAVEAQKKQIEEKLAEQGDSKVCALM